MSGGMIVIDTSGLADIVMSTDGDMIDYVAASGGRTRLPIGAANTVLTSVGGFPTWQLPAGSAGQELLYDNQLAVKTTGTVFEADFSADPLTSTDYSSFDMWLSGVNDGTNPFTTDLNFIIDRSTANSYYSIGNMVNAAGAATWTIDYPATTGTIADTSIFDSSNKSFAIHIVGGFNPTRTSDFNIFTETFQYSNAYSANRMINGWGLLSVANQISYLGIGLTTEGMGAGTRFTIWGNKRT